MIIHPHGLKIEQNAIDQLNQVAGWNSIDKVMGLPDMHLGKIGPVGCAVLSQNVFPSLLGSDVGCGFLVMKINLKEKKLRDQEYLIEKLNGLDIFDEEYSKEFQNGDLEFNQFGTIGGGNHFIEITRVASSYNNIHEEGDVFLLVHSGSRRYGEEVFREAVETVKDGPILDPTLFENWYLKHNRLLEFAKINRKCVAYRVLDRLGIEGEIITDVFHNFVEKTNEGFIHRKGANPAKSICLISGTRSTPSFLVQPDFNTCKIKSLSSLPHGAGRALSRSQAKNITGNIESLRSVAPITKSGIPSYIISGDESIIKEEQARAYKDINTIIKAVESNALAKVIAELHPVITFKTSQESNLKKDRTRDISAKMKSIEKKKWRRS